MVWHSDFGLAYLLLIFLTWKLGWRGCGRTPLVGLSWNGPGVWWAFSKYSLGLVTIRGPQRQILAPTFPFAGSFCSYTLNTGLPGLEGVLGHDTYHMIHPRWGGWYTFFSRTHTLGEPDWSQINSHELPLLCGEFMVSGAYRVHYKLFIPALKAFSNRYQDNHFSIPISYRSTAHILFCSQSGPLWGSVSSHSFPCPLHHLISSAQTAFSPPSSPFRILSILQSSSQYPLPPGKLPWLSQSEVLLALNTEFLCCRLSGTLPQAWFPHGPKDWYPLVHSLHNPLHLQSRVGVWGLGEWGVELNQWMLMGYYSYDDVTNNWLGINKKRSSWATLA